MKSERCPICDARVEPESPSRPFCSPRCSSADLGQWLSGGYQIGSSGRVMSVPHAPASGEETECD